MKVVPGAAPPVAAAVSALVVVPPPEHINFFGGETLAGVAEKAGLRLIVYQTPFVQSCWSYYTACKNWANGNIFLFLASFSVVMLGVPYYLYESLNGRGMESFAVLEKAAH